MVRADQGELINLIEGILKKFRIRASLPDDRALKALLRLDDASGSTQVEGRMLTSYPDGKRTRSTNVPMYYISYLQSIICVNILL